MARTPMGILALFTLLFVPLLVSAVNVPPSLALVHKEPRIAVPPTLLERDTGDLDERATTCGSLTACSSGGCCRGSCCGNGCCATGYYCDPVDGVAACCQNGHVCSNQISGCVTSGYLPCRDFDFCCPAGDLCYLDSAGNARCTTGGGNGDGNTYTSTSWYTYTEYVPTTTTYSYEVTTSTTRTTLVATTPAVVHTTPTSTRTTSTTPLLALPTSSSDSGISDTGSSSSNGARQVVAQGAVGVVALIAGAMLL